jgi:type IV fimbrial biogenesis protein FimT
MKTKSPGAAFDIRSRNRETGFTLIELLTAVAVVGILAALAVPSFREFIASQRVKTASFDLQSLLIMARSEAIKRNGNVTLSGIGSGTLAITAADGTVIQQREGFSGLTLTCNPSPCSNVVYTGSGRLAATVPTIEIGAAATNQLRCISIDLSGRPSSKKEAC